MTGMSSSATDAAPLSSPPELPAAKSHGGYDSDKNTFFPLLDLVERFPDLFEQRVLAHLDPIDPSFLAQTGGACRAAVAASDLPRAGEIDQFLGKLVWVVTHIVRDFCTSVERLAWAKASGCPWAEFTCACAALGGHLEVLRWARENGCPWDDWTCTLAARDGHLEVLRWAREQHCAWNEATCCCAACGGHLEVLQWAREHGCPWRKSECEYAAG